MEVLKHSKADRPVPMNSDVSTTQIKQLPTQGLLCFIYSQNNNNPMDYFEKISDIIFPP